uniref:Uncharacterized protein n=1 Tax=Oryza brachyantha TaxID=4533 RepID=J3KYK7_ORYBR
MAERAPTAAVGEEHAMDAEAPASVAAAGGDRRSAARGFAVLRSFLAVQQRRAEAYSTLRRGFSAYMANGSELAFQQLCGSVTAEFNDCSKQVIEMVALLSTPEICRSDVANLLKDVQAHEREKLHLTARIQVLKKAGRPSERLVNHADCRSSNMAQHVCVHVKEITEAAGTEDAEADAEYDGALKEAIQGVQAAVTSINEHMEEVRYEIDALESEIVGNNLAEVEEAFPDTLLIK